MPALGEPKIQKKYEIDLPSTAAYRLGCNSDYFLLKLSNNNNNNKTTAVV